MKSKSEKNLFWFRRDLRLKDNAGLFFASKNSHQLYTCFILDKNILGKLDDKQDSRVTFIIHSLLELNQEISKRGGSLILRYGDPQIEIPKLAQQLKVQSVFCNRDYEDVAKRRDQAVLEQLQKVQIEFYTFKDQVIFESREILNQAGEVYKVFTPYKNKWLERFSSENLINFTNSKLVFAVYKKTEKDFKKQAFRLCGFKPKSKISGGAKQAALTLKKFIKKMPNYHHDRDYPYIEGTSRLSEHIRHGTISIRELLRQIRKHPSKGAAVFQSELIWREFYQMILDLFPHTKYQSYKPKYDQIKWLGTEENFQKWCNGYTGYPLVDAAMRCLNETGFMHNRLRMVTASFLCKTLLVDWKKGETYFAKKLLDYDTASNVGGWQWSASIGCDAQPYFRIFNPMSQSKKFDPQGIFIKKFVVELKQMPIHFIHEPHKAPVQIQNQAKCLIGKDYPAPIVDYKKMRELALFMYSELERE